MTVSWKKAERLQQEFLKLKHKHSNCVVEPRESKTFDWFVSDVHKDDSRMHVVRDELALRRPDLRIFVDRQELKPGMAWQQELNDAIENSRRVLAFYSPAYVDSRVCMEEFNLAMCRRHKESRTDFLIPIYLSSAALDSRMKQLQYIDCRDGGEQRLREASNQLSDLL